MRVIGLAVGLACIRFLSATILDSQTKIVASLPKTLPIIPSDHRT
jgi:hypothetical protein